MKKFKDRPIKSKLTIFILVSTLIAVTALSSVFLAQRYTNYQAQITKEFTTITKIIADRSNAAMLFEDQQALNETLSSLALHADVLIACTYNSGGDLLAEFNPTPEIRSCPLKPPTTKIIVDADNIDISEPILADGNASGTVFVSSSTEKMKQELKTAFFNVVALSIFMVLAALVFASYIQRFISDPLVRLKNAASQVSLDRLEFNPLHKQNKDEVGELVDAFNQMRQTIAKQNAVILDNTDTLEKKVEERTRDLAMANQELEAFSYSVSHDLKAPLRIIEGFSQALEEDYGQQLDDTAKDYLLRVRAGSYKMSQLINSLLMLSRVTRQELTKDKIDLTKLAERTIKEVRAQNPSHPLTINIQQNMSVLGDEDLIEVALDNLIGNAWKYSQKKDETRIEVGTTRIKGQDVYYVKDNGAGFNMRYADLVLKPFNRLHTPQEFEGSGIGLATVNRIIERHRGKIWFQSTVGEGSIFYFTLFPDSSNSDVSESPIKANGH